MKKLTCFIAATICIVLSSSAATEEKISKKAAKKDWQQLQLQKQKSPKATPE